MYAEVLVLFSLFFSHGLVGGGADIVRALMDFSSCELGKLAFIQCDRGDQSDDVTKARVASRPRPAAPKKYTQPKGAGARFGAKKLEQWKAEIADLICSKPWDCRTAVAVAMAESGLNCGSVSRTNDHGLFQLHGQKIYDCRENIDRAYEMWKRRGWQPWSAFKNGKYKRFLSIYR